MSLTGSISFWTWSHSWKKVKVVSNSLWPHRRYSPWNSPGQNTGVGRHSLLQRIFPVQGSGLPHCRWILYQMSHKGSPRILEWVAYIPSPGDLPDSGTELDSLPAEPPGRPSMWLLPLCCLHNSICKVQMLWASQWLSGKEPACQCRGRRRWKLDPWVGKIPWRRKWQPSPVFLPRRSHGQRRLQSMGSQRVGHECTHTVHLVIAQCVGGPIQCP